MKIILAEMSGQQTLFTHELKQPTIRIGRDPSRSDLVLDQTKWPMVSRQHAEIRLEPDRCILVDLNSTHGTFVNDQRILEPSPIRAGTHIRLGPAGPVLKVEFIELPSLAGDTILERRPQPPSASVDQPPSSSAVQPSSPPSQVDLDKLAYLILEKGAATPLEHQIYLDKPQMLLGRDPSSDILINAAAAVVSRRHAVIEKSDGHFRVVDLHSFNGTLVNGQRINQPMQLMNGDRIQLGPGGPILRFVHPASIAANRETKTNESVRQQTDVVQAIIPEVSHLPVIDELLHTVVVHSKGAATRRLPAVEAAQLVMRRSFDLKTKISIGRAKNNDIQLDSLIISNHHATFTKTAAGVFVQDAGSTNGVYVNGVRISGRKPIQNGDLVGIGPFLIQSDASGIVVLDTRSNLGINAIEITKIVSDRKKGTVRLLDDIDLAVQPNEFVGLLGTSGAGKTTLMNALNGMSPASSGLVLINNLDLYQHLDSLKQSIGYVPQDDIIHRELTVYHTLYYVARMRLPPDVDHQETDQIINQVLDVTGLGERRDLPVAKLSGGQRKRVSIAVELITKPSALFLDEPTAGLDPSTEDKIMLLFREIAESGRTVVVTTHAMENVRLFDKIALLMQGKLVFYGTPSEGLEFFGATNFRDLYEKLQAPVETLLGKLLPLSRNATREQKRTYEQQRNEIVESVAAAWQASFRDTEVYQRNIRSPLEQIEPRPQTSAPAKRRPGFGYSIRQWKTLVRRYAEVLAGDKPNLLILFAQAPVIGLLTFFVVGKQDPRDFLYFVLALVSIWFGTSVAAREIVKERAIYKRERMVNLALFPYVGSKLFLLSLIVGTQCTLLFTVLKAFHFAGLLSVPGVLAGLPQLLTMVLAGIVGITLGLLVSALVKTSEMATSVLPLILIPQILFCGLAGVPHNISKIAGAIMPATWAFDEMKRLSQLETLREEGAKSEDQTAGRGLYKHLEEANQTKIADARRAMEQYKSNSEQNLRQFEQQVKEYVAAKERQGQAVQPPTAPAFERIPSIPDPESLSPDLSRYINFKHSWGGTFRNPIILLVMSVILLITTIIVLRLQDVR